MRKLIHKASRQLSMLQHMIKFDKLNGVVGSVNAGVVVAKGCLKHKRRRVSIAVGRGVVGASVSAKTLFVGNLSVVADEQLDVLILGRVGEVGDETEALNAIATGEANHVLVQHGHDLHIQRRILAEDVLGAKQARLLGGVPMPLKGVAVVAIGDAGVGEDSAKNLEDH